jgi:formylglycine-generating enzyme required for sulfatase activity
MRRRRRSSRAVGDSAIRGISRALLVAVFVMGGTATKLEAADSSKVAVRLELVTLPIAGGKGARCSVTREVETGAKETFRITFGEVDPDSSQKRKATGAGTLCREDGQRERESLTPGSSDAPYLILETSISSVRLSRFAIEMVMSLSTRKLSGFSPAGKPIYSLATHFRNYRLEEGDDGIVPVLIADPGEQKDFGVREVVLRVSARVAPAPATPYGALSIRTDVAGAEILLDGGRVGRTSNEKVAHLQNVPAGDRVILLRDAGGREARRMVRVRKDRKILVALGLSSSLAPQPNGIVPIGTNDQGYEAYRRKRDGARMVKVPGGGFLMGNLETEGRPLPHPVQLSTFLMDEIPVTWARYERFLEASGIPFPPDEPYWGIREDHPVVFVTWEESRAYCEWVGGRLPTEAEREKAARGTDDRKYPWGNEEPDSSLAVFRRNWGSEATAPVGERQSGASPYGLLDMAGNVWEWCEDWYDPRYYEVSPRENPNGAATGQSRVVRGGSWDSRPGVLSTSARNFGYVGYREGDFGFRCAADAP